MKRLLLIGFLMLFSISPLFIWANTAAGATIVVSSIADSGPNTLRRAIIDAQNGDTITFDLEMFPPGSPATIQLNTELPALDKGNMTIDASNAGVILDGSPTPEGHDGIRIYSDGNVIKGLQILNFGADGVAIKGGAQNNTVGGDRAAGAGPFGEGNLISGNNRDGIAIADDGTINNRIAGNYIGVGAGGMTAHPNGGHGVALYNGATLNLIGGNNGSPGGACSGDCNLISGNNGRGIWLEGGATQSNTISGNYIGTNVNGTACVRNGGESIAIRYGPSFNVIGGETAAERNLTGCSNITIGNPWSDGSSHNRIVNNYIGVDPSDTTVFSNVDYQGILLCGDGLYTQILSNTIRGLSGQGIWVAATGAGCWGEALTIDAGVLIQGNTISGNGLDGFYHQAIRIEGAQHVTLRQNSAYNNIGPAIDLRDGANADIGAPVILVQDLAAGTASGTACANCLVELYSDEGDEGRYYEGEVIADADGHWNFDKGSEFAGAYVRATATDSNGNSSSFAVNLYVNGSGGSDTPDCSDSGTPCATIGFAESQASQDDTIFVAAGRYIENLVVDERVTLSGGFEAAGWSRDVLAHETILDGSGGETVLGAWDSNRIYAPTVISTTAQFEMWYTGMDSSGDLLLGHATSPDGKTWTKSVSNPLLSGEEATALYEGPADYKMWYSLGVTGIYRATSPDGITWTDGAAPVFEPTYLGDSWEGGFVGDPSIVRDGNGTYWMFYEAVDFDQGIVQIGVVTSTDGLDWTRIITGPVLTPGDLGSWDESHVLDPMVILDGSTFKMWYRGIDRDWTAQIGYAISPDGLTWTKDSANNPVLQPEPGGWDEERIHSPAVYYNGEYHLWYSSQTQIGYATSQDGITWSKYDGNPILAPGTPTQWCCTVVRFENGSNGSTLRGLTVTGGEGEFAGGVDAGDYQITIDNSIIDDNFAAGFPSSQGGGGVLCSGHNCLLTIVGSQIINNRAGEGASGVRVGNGTLLMTNTLVANNSGAEGLHLNGPAELINVTIAGNGSEEGRPGINYNPQVDAQLSIVNTILHGNGGAIHVPDSDLVDVSHSDIQGGWEGTNNIDEDPLFIDPDNGDYHLTSDSPAMDAGTAVGAPAYDIDGDRRPLFDGVDMGADEVTTITGEMTAAGGTMNTPDGTTISIPAGAMSRSVIISYSRVDPVASGEQQGPGLFYKLAAVYADNGSPATLQPGMTYTVIASYDESNLADGVDEADLKLHYWDGTDWVAEPTSTVDTVADTISATPDHFSLWAALTRARSYQYLPQIYLP